MLGGKGENIIECFTLFHNAPRCWDKWENLGAGSGIYFRVRDLTCRWKVAATVACLTGTSTWIILMQSAASLVTFLSRIVGAQQFFSISLNMCSIGWLIRSANQNLRQTLGHAWPISSCWKHVFCRQCVNWTINTQYTFHSLNGCFF